MPLDSTVRHNGTSLLLKKETSEWHWLKNWWSAYHAAACSPSPPFDPGRQENARLTVTGAFPAIVASHGILSQTTCHCCGFVLWHLLWGWTFTISAASVLQEKQVFNTVSDTFYVMGSIDEDCSLITQLPKRGASLPCAEGRHFKPRKESVDGRWTGRKVKGNTMKGLGNYSIAVVAQMAASLKACLRLVVGTSLLTDLRFGF